MRMRHDVLQLFTTLAVFLSTQTANGTPYQFNYDVVGDSDRVFPLPAGYVKPQLLESSPIRSQLLEIYSKQEKSTKFKLNYSKQDGAANKPQDLIGLEENYNDKIYRVVPKHQFIEDIFIVSREYNIDPLLLHAIAEIESAFNSEAISKAGARGLMQVMPDTARRFGMQNPMQELFNPISNLRVSSNYIRTLYSLFGNNIPLILAAYNAGENAVIKYGYKIPPYRETENYVNKVMKRYLQLKEKSYQL